jgi:hypothetical protein
MPSAGRYKKKVWPLASRMNFSAIKIWSAGRPNY